MAMETNQASDGSIGAADPRRRRKLVYFQEADAKSDPGIPGNHVLSQADSNSPLEDLSGHGCFADSPKSAMSKTFFELSKDLIQLQNRVMELNERVSVDPDLPPFLNDLKSQVENLRNKLEAIEILSLAERSQKPSDAHLHEVYLQFQQLWDKPLTNKVSYELFLPSFDAALYSDSEMLVFLQHMFLQFKFHETFKITLPVLRNFLYEVYKNYNDVPFHNFRHCFCVTQMMYSIICHTMLHQKLGDADTLILLVSCICHDLDHPGYNNIYQINARTELALRYNDISPLENHHCSVAFRILKNHRCNIFENVDKEVFKEFREGIIRCILATDMARHNEILAQFKEISKEFDFENRTHRNLLSMVLIKVADISNEARPLEVAEPWLDRLLTEFFQQSDLEKLQGLPVTPFMDRDKITKPSSQCSFIGFVLLPLFETLGELFPELQRIIIEPARAALEHYKKLNEAAKDERLRRKSVIENGSQENLEESPHMVKSSSGLSVGRKSLSGTSTQSRQRSRSSEEDPSPPVSPVSILFEPDLDFNQDEDELITATEVEVSEKAIKFKISTEAATPGRNTCPNSRKGSREKCQIEKDCQVINYRPEIGDNSRRKSFAVVESRLKNPDDQFTTGKKRRSSIRAMDSIEIDPSSWHPAPTTYSTIENLQPAENSRKLSETSEHSRVASSESPLEFDKPTLMAKLRSLKEKLQWSEKSDEEDSRPNSLPTRKSGKKKGGKGWRHWLQRDRAQSSSWESFPQN